MTDTLASVSDTSSPRAFTHGEEWAAVGAEQPACRGCQNTTEDGHKYCDNCHGKHLVRKAQLVQSRLIVRLIASACAGVLGFLIGLFLNSMLLASTSIVLGALVFCVWPLLTKPARKVSAPKRNFKKRALPSAYTLAQVSPATPELAARTCKSKECDASFIPKNATKFFCPKCASAHYEAKQVAKSK